MESEAFALIATALLGFGLVSGKLQRSILTPPMVFVGIGFIIGPLGFGWLNFEIERDFIHILAQLTLIMVLFTDASRIDLRLLKEEHDLPLRLLIIGLPLTIIFGGIVAANIFGILDIWEAFVLAVILAPTDAALGQAVMNSPLVPIRIRQSLNIESGINDGLVLPLVLVLIACSSLFDPQGGAASYWLGFAAKQVILGPLVGIAIGLTGGFAVEKGIQNGWINQTYKNLSAVGIALISYSGAELVGGNGFIGAFCAGLGIGNFCKSICGSIYEFGEAEGQLLSLLTFLIFGLVMVPMSVDKWNVEIFVYALLSLTIIRMVPVAISLFGKKLRWSSIFFLGWFGPRGLASILFGLLVVGESTLPHKEIIFTIVNAVVLFSVVAHGISAYPGALWYSKQIKTCSIDSKSCELAEITEMPVRYPHQE